MGRVKRCGWIATLGVVLALLIGVCASAVTIQDHAFVTTVDDYTVAEGRVVGYVDLINEATLAETVQVSAEFYDADGCYDDVLANWSNATVIVPAEGSLRVLFRLVYVSETAVQNAHGDPDCQRDATLELSYRVFVGGVMAQDEADVIADAAFYDTQVSYTQSLPLTAIRGYPVIPPVDMDADLNVATGYACEPYFEGEFFSIIDADPNAAWDLGFESGLILAYHHDLIEVAASLAF